MISLRSGLWKCLSFGLLAAQAARAAITLDIDDDSSLKNAAATAVYGMMSYYHGNESGQIPGTMDGTWWEVGAMFMTLIQYWHFTGDDSYNSVVTQGLLFQVGEHDDYMPANWTSFIGNDDQLFWGLAAMTAAELKFPDGPDDSPSWLALAQAVFNEQASRWDPNTCGGGLHWQILPVQNGYNVKNSISNGGFAQLGARLARYTGNDTYAQWTEKMWDWCGTTPLLNTNTWVVGDTVEISTNCRSGDQLQWTYNYGTFISAAAYMHNYTNGSPIWSSRIDGLLNVTLGTFFPVEYGGDIMSEVACETVQTCNRNHLCFKGFLSSWLAFTATMAPYTAPLILPRLRASAQGAALQCSGTPAATSGISSTQNGVSCGRRWYQNTWDGFTGFEEQMSAASVFTSNLVRDSTLLPPVTANTGGISKGDPSAGSNADSGLGGSGSTANLEPITTADRAGAIILTVLIGGVWVALMYWISTD